MFNALIFDGIQLQHRSAANQISRLRCGITSCCAAGTLAKNNDMNIAPLSDRLSFAFGFRDILLTAAQRCRKCYRVR